MAGSGLHPRRETLPRIRIEVLHHFCVLIDGSGVPLPDSAERIVAQLALSERAQPRDTVAHALWPDRGDSESRATVRRALWRLNRSVPGLIVRSGTYMSLVEAVACDLAEVRALADAAGAGSPPRVGREEIRLLEGDLLPQWSDEWLDGPRESLRQVRLHTLEALARSSLDDGRPGDALTLALAAAGIDPLRESAHRIVISAHLQEANDAAALRQYGIYRDLLWREMRLRPSRQMQALLADAVGPAIMVETLDRNRLSNGQVRSVRALRANAAVRN